MQLILLLFLFALSAFGQFSTTARHIVYGANLPATCSPLTGDVYVKNNTNPTVAYLCTATNTWTAFTAGSGGGTVTSVSGSGPAWLTWTVGTPTTTPAISLAPTTGQTSHQVIGTCNAATTFAPCALVAGDLPATAVTPGSYTSTNLTVDQQGRITAAASGTGGGTVTVVGAGSLTSTALVTGGGTTTIQTPAATATLDASGNLSTPGTLSTGVGGATAGALDLGAGTAHTAAGVGFQAPTSVSTPFMFTLPAAPAAGLLHATNATPSVLTSSAVSLTADVTGTLPVANGGTSLATLTAHALYVGNGTSAPTALAVGATDKPVVGVTGADPVFSKVTLTNPATAATLTIADNKTLTASNSITLAGTDSTTMTFPSVSSTITRTVASGAKALATGAISSAACTTAQTDTATGTLTTDTIIATFNGDPTAVTGYVPLTAGMLTIIIYPTADTFNAKVCNNTSSSITPGAITLNWRVVR